MVLASREVFPVRKHSHVSIIFDSVADWVWNWFYPVLPCALCVKDFEQGIGTC
jgi:hypothetical protein